MVDFPYPGKYTFVDVEIPNLNNNCICAISLIVIEDKKEVLRHTELINPLSFFSYENIKIHHIYRKDVLGSRTLEQFWKDYGRFFGPDYIVAAHNAMSDITVLNKDLARINKQIGAVHYIDTMDIMDQFYYKGNQQKGDLKLSSIADRLGIELDHHNPESDVNACFEIVRYMYHYFSMDLNPFIKEIRPPRKKAPKPVAVPSTSQIRSLLSYTHRQIAMRAPSVKVSAKSAKKRGDDAYGRGDYQGVIFNYELAASKHWQTPTVYLRLAEVYDSLHMRHDALRILDQGIRNLTPASKGGRVLRNVQNRIRKAGRDKSRKPARRSGQQLSKAESSNTTSPSDS